MKLRFDAVVVVLALLLPACSTEDDTQPATVVTEEVTEAKAVGAFHFDSGTLELGPFDPLEVYPNVFDPCQEISNEEFAELGYTTDGITVPFYDNTLMGCVLLATGNQAAEDLVLAGSLASKDDFLEQAEVISEDVSAEVPGMFLFVASNDFNNCGASISTERGHLIALSSDTMKSQQQKAQCQRVIEFLERLKEL